MDESTEVSHRATRPNYGEPGMGAAPLCGRCGRPVHYAETQWVHDEDGRTDDLLPPEVFATYAFGERGMDGLHVERTEHGFAVTVASSGKGYQQVTYPLSLGEFERLVEWARRVL